MFTASTLQKIVLVMASSKPTTHRLPNLAGNAEKRARTVTTAAAAAAESAFKDPFANYADYLNNLNEKRERIVKASRDITMNSKKVIFQVHRMSKNNREEVLEKAQSDLSAVTQQYVSRLVKELQGSDFWKLRRAYSPGVQEYVEAATFCNFCKNGTLLTLDEMNATLLPLSDPALEPLQINVLDYLLGLADLTGELMRMAIGRISDGEIEYAEKICQFVREIYRELTITVPHMDDSHDMKQKMDTMLQSVIKIENGMNFLNWYGTKPQLVITDPELVKEVLSNKEGTFPKKFIQSYAYKFLGNGLFASQGEKWTKMRKLANQAFHGDCLKAMIPAMVASVETMLAKWEEEASIEIDAFKEFRILTSEVISRTAFGSSYKEGKNVFDMLMQLGSIVHRNNFKAGIPSFGIFKLWRSVDDVESDRLQVAIREGIIEVIRKRTKGSFHGSGDFLGSLLNAYHEESDSPRKISVDDLVDECKSFYVGGHETITNSLTWTVFLLAIHTEWQDKAREEVVELFDQRNPCLDGLARMKTMTMIINESLRLYPPALNLTREVEKETKLGKFTLPAKMALSLPIIAIHQNPLLWGEDCHLFKPIRFADGAARAAVFLPFGFGPRTCVGSSFATAEIKIALSMILQRFRWSISPSYVHSPFHMLTICPKHGLQIVLQPV